jgi:hypothetical protein
MPPQNLSRGGKMAYTGSYTTADLTPIVADGLGTAGAIAVSFMAIIVIIGILLWGYRKMKRVR